MRFILVLSLQVTFKIVEEHPRDLAEGLDTINVVFGDETIPQLYENSHISEEQLVGHPGTFHCFSADTPGLLSICEPYSTISQLFGFAYPLH